MEDLKKLQQKAAQLTADIQKSKSQFQKWKLKKKNVKTMSEQPVPPTKPGTKVIPDPVEALAKSDPPAAASPPVPPAPAAPEQPPPTSKKAPEQPPPASTPKPAEEPKGITTKNITLEVLVWRMCLGMFAIAFLYDIIGLINAAVPSPDAAHWIFTPFIWKEFLAQTLKDFAVLALGAVVKLYNSMVQKKSAELGIVI